MSFQDEAIRLPLGPLASLRPRQALLECNPRPRLASGQNGGERLPHILKAHWNKPE
jgi:hypothetical protein